MDVKLTQSYDENGDIAYHFLIDQSGTIFEGRSMTYQGAHVAGHNPGNIGIAFLGDFTKGPLSKEQMLSGLLLMADLIDKHKIDPKNIFTHAQFDNDKAGELAGATSQISKMKALLGMHVLNSSRGYENTAFSCKFYDAEKYLREGVDR